MRLVQTELLSGTRWITPTPPPEQKLGKATLLEALIDRDVSRFHLNINVPLFVLITLCVQKDIVL